MNTQTQTEMQKKEQPTTAQLQTEISLLSQLVINSEVAKAEKKVNRINNVFGSVIELKRKLSNGKRVSFLLSEANSEIKNIIGFDYVATTEKQKVTPEVALLLKDNVSRKVAKAYVYERSKAEAKPKQ